MGSLLRNSSRTDHISAFPPETRPASQGSVGASPDVRPYCKCRGTCFRRQFKCVKEGISCDDEKCGCEGEKCQNRELQLPESTTDDGTDLTSSAGTLNTTFNVAYVDTASEADTTSESKDSSSNVLKDKNSAANPKKRSADGNTTVKSYHTLFDSSEEKKDDSMKDFDTEKVGLGGLKKRKRKTLMNKGSKSLFDPPKLGIYSWKKMDVCVNL